MTIDEVREYMGNGIPLSRKAGMRIEILTAEKVVVSAPLEENRNVHNSVFGGSISMAMILSGWLMAREIAEMYYPGASIVISRQTVDFIKPVRSDFSALALAPGTSRIEAFLVKMNEQGRASLEIEVAVSETGKEETCAGFSGTFHIRLKK